MKRSDTLRVLVDARMGVRGLGISTVVDRLVAGFTAHPSVTLSRWQGTGEWGRAAKLTTLAKSGLFDISPRLDPRTHPFDVVHFLSNVGSIFPGSNSVLTVQDLLYRRSPKRRQRAYGYLLERSLPRAGKIVAPSARTASEIRHAFPALRSSIDVIPYGMRRLPPPEGARTHLLAFGGGTDPRKRTDLMVDVYREYRETTKDPLPLRVVSRAGITPRQAEQLRVLDADIVADATSAERDRMVAGAAAILHTTIAEGFGLPIVEAGEVGTPVVMDAGADVATEVLGRHCVFVRETGLPAWAEALRRAVANGPVPDALDLPDWQEVASRYIALYREVS